jgi:DNA polymerase
MLNLKDFRIVGHVHDEVIIKCPQDQSVEEITDIMSETPPWLPGLELKADGYACTYYRKE